MKQTCCKTGFSPGVTVCTDVQMGFLFIIIAQTTVTCKKQLQWTYILKLLINAYNTAVIIIFQPECV